MAKETDLINMADELHKEANSIIFDRGLDTILKAYGKVFYTGSYFLDVMVWPDLDIDVVLEPDPYSFDTLFELGKKIARLKGVWSVEFRNFISHPVKKYPRALYCGVRIDRVNSDGYWKIDLWAVNDKLFEDDKAEMEGILKAMDPSKRKFILEIKHSLLTPEGRMPPPGSYSIYQAVLFKGLVKKEDVVAYFRNQTMSLG